MLAADVPSRDAHPDHVAAVHPPSQLLASLTVRRPVRTALDVGTGNGVQALLLAAHADRVVATDVSERALAFAAFNAALNGVENVELRLGSFLEPVEGERFGVAVANPPYVISPEAEYVFRDAGLGRDRVSEELVRAFPAVLEEGAFGSVMLSWIEDGDGDPPHAWLEGARCDAFLFRTRPQDPLDAAAAWNAGVPDKERERRIVRWLDYFARERIDAIAYGTLVLRRRAERGWFRSARLPEGPSEPAGEHLELLFANQDALLALDDEQLLERRVVVAPHTLFEHVNASGDGGWTTTEAALAVRAGIRFRATLDAPSAGFVAALDPTLPLREVIAAAAAARGVPEPEFAPPALATVRHLLELGFAALAPVPVPGAPPPLAPA